MNMNIWHKLFPLHMENKELQILNINELTWYVNNCTKDYYNEYLEFKFSKDIMYDTLLDTIKTQIISYDNNGYSPWELRLLLKDNDNKIYAGCTIFLADNSDAIQLAYFVLPEYQNKGIGAYMISTLCKELSKSEIKFNKFIVTVREDNIASLKMVNKIGFNEVKRDSGKSKDIITLQLSRLSVA